VRFRIRIPYAAPADAVARAYADPALYEAFAGLPRADRPEVLDHRVDGDSAVLRVRWRFSGALSPAARAVIDPDRLTWVEESTHDVARRQVTFRMIPDHYRDRFTCSGGYRFEPDGAGSVRIVEGDLRIKAPLIGGTVEKAIVSGLEDHLISEAPLVEAFLDAGG
jgi:Protein of unknown function (DUF2505)